MGAHARAFHLAAWQRQTCDMIALCMVTISVRSPAGEVLKVAVAGGTARMAVSDGFVSRALSSFTQPQPLMPVSTSSWHSFETLYTQFVSHFIFFEVSIVHAQS